MGQVSKAINGRNYRLSCNDGEEQRLSELLSYVDTHVSLLVEDFGQVGEDRLMLMTALKIADELWDLRDELEENARRAQEELRELAAQSDMGRTEGRANLDKAETDVDEPTSKADDNSDDDSSDLDDDDQDMSEIDPDGADIGIEDALPQEKKRAYR